LPGSKAHVKKKAMKKVKKQMKKKVAMIAVTKRMKKKPASWLRLRPQGCPKCRDVPGCSPSCWEARGGPPP